MQRHEMELRMQQESDVHNYLFNQPSIVGSKHNSALQCANPQCSKQLFYLREGTLNLLEMNRILTTGSSQTSAHLR